MNDNAFVLMMLSDGKPHTVEEINARSRLERGRSCTVHSRVAELRKQGHVISAFSRSKRLGNGTYGYVYHGKIDGRSRVKAPNPVQGYEFMSVDSPHNGHICKILARKSASESELVEYGPAFEVEFGDGSVEVAFASELRPWYPT